MESRAAASEEHGPVPAGEQRTGLVLWLGRVEALLVRLPTWAFLLSALVATFVVAVPLALVMEALGVSMGNALEGFPILLAISIGVIVMPPIETLVCQWAPFALCRRLKLSKAIAIVVSAIVFGVLHSYNPWYMLQAFFIGLVLAFTYVLAERRRESPFWMVTGVHAARNAVTVLVLALS